jgi:hypothetical protein
VLFMLGFLVKFKGFWQAEMSSQELYARGMLKKEFPGSKFIHLIHYSTSWETVSELI